jgi:hypothetical protein
MKKFTIKWTIIPVLFIKKEVILGIMAAMFSLTPQKQIGKGAAFEETGSAAWI